MSKPCRYLGHRTVPKDDSDVLIDGFARLLDTSSMPHFVLEYSDNITPRPDFKTFGETLHRTLAGFESFKLEEIKSRCVCHRDFYLGNGDARNAFVHLRLEILSGRAASLKTAVGEKLLELLKEEFKTASSTLKLDISIEIRDMVREAYFKASGTIGNKS